jgi:3-oxoacyl-[acyl-carrier-protein] synthase II
LTIYIKSFHSISSLKDNTVFTASEDNLRSHVVIEPDYEELLDVRSMRRLSKVLKMGVYSSLRCLQSVNSDDVDGIITGTGLGCTADTLAFLENMISRDEHLLTPTAFIQSTHNTLSGTLGIMLKNHGYNMTWYHEYRTRSW